MRVKNFNKKMIFDYVIVGSSPLAILQASHYKFRKNKILVIDKNSFIGGAWASIKIFGFTNVENAIHYFLPSNFAIKFLKNYLHLSIIQSKKKIRILEKSFFGKKHFHYDSIIGKFLTQFQQKKFNKLFSLYFVKSLFYKSHYLKNGSKDLIQYLKKIIFFFKIKILLNHSIKKIEINSKEKFVKLSVKAGKKNFCVISRKLCITHGLKINKFFGDLGDIKINPLKELRPCLHICLHDNLESKANELIFNNDNLIKYVHDVTEYVDKKIKNKKILVLALHPKIKNTKKNFVKIINKLKKEFLISKNSKVLGYKWTDIFLPELTDETLVNIYKKYPNQIDFMLSDNFTLGIDLYSDNWKFLKNIKL